MIQSEKDKKLNSLVTNLILESNKATSKVLKKLKAYKIFNEIERQASSKLNTYLKESSKRYVLSKSGTNLEKFINSPSNKKFNELSHKILENDFYNYNFENDKKISKIISDKQEIKNIKKSAILIKEMADTIYKNNKKINHVINKKNKNKSKDNNSLLKKNTIIFKPKLEQRKSLENIQNLNKNNLQEEDKIKSKKRNVNNSLEGNKIIKIIMDESNKIENRIKDYSQRITENAYQLNADPSKSTIDAIGINLRREKLNLGYMALLTYEKESNENINNNKNNKNNSQISKNENLNEEINLNKLNNLKKMNRILSLKSDNTRNIKEFFKNKYNLNNEYNQNNQYINANNSNNLQNILEMPFITEPNIDIIKLKRKFDYKNTNELITETAKKNIVLRDVLEDKKRRLNKYLETLPNIENYENIINKKSCEINNIRKKKNKNVSESQSNQYILTNGKKLRIKIAKGLKNIDYFEKHVNESFNKFKEDNYKDMIAKLRIQMDELKKKI